MAKNEKLTLDKGREQETRRNDDLIEEAIRKADEDAYRDMIKALDKSKKSK